MTIFEIDIKYFCRYETDNGIQAHETSVQNGNDKVVRGSYSYVGPDGLVYTVNYVADKYGYRAYGAHLPTQPDAVINQVQRIASSPSTIDPYIVQTNPNIRPGVIQVSPDFTYSSTTIAPPIVRTTLISPPEQIITYSTTPSPYRKGLYDTPLPEITYSSTPSPILEPNIIIPSNTMQPPLQYIPSISTPVTRFPYISATNVNLEEFIYSSTPRPSYNQPLPSSSQSTYTDYSDNDTVYITPPPKTYIHPVTTYEYLQRELLPPYPAQNQQQQQQQNNWNVPNVRPLVSYDRYYNSPALPQRFYKK